MTYRGGCHCGRISYTVDGAIEQVVECNCSLCSKRGYLLWFVPRAQLRLETPEAALATYTFNTGRIRHHFCAECGCAPFGMGTDNEGNATVAVNVRCLEGIDIPALTVVAVDGRKF